MIDYEILSMVSNHLKNENQIMYLGPDYGAHYPQFFTQPSKLLNTYKKLKKIITPLRFTASLYSRPQRILAAAENVWCIAQDFDFDRNGWEDIPRTQQDETLYTVCQDIPPTFCTQTRNGYHLFWVLETPIPVFEYTYISGLIQKQLNADPHSVVPVHCLSAHATGRKPAALTDRIHLSTTGQDILLYPHNLNIYTPEQIKNTIIREKNPKLRVLSELLHTTKLEKTYEFECINDEIDNLIEHYDILSILRKAGYRAYGRGGTKIIMCCPYHPDRNPSAFLNLNPNDQYYGCFTCVSCGKRTNLPNLLKHLKVI